MGRTCDEGGHIYDVWLLAIHSVVSLLNVICQSHAKCNKFQCMFCSFFNGRGYEE